MTDVLVDVSADLVVYRVGGVWQYRGRGKMTKASVVAELLDLAARADVRSSLLKEAAVAIQMQEDAT